MNLIHFLHVCQGFAIRKKKKLFWHNRGVPKNKIKLKAAPKLSNELFVPGLFIVEIKTHTSVQWVLRNISEMSVTSYFRRLPHFSNISET